MIYNTIVASQPEQPITTEPKEQSTLSCCETTATRACCLPTCLSLTAGAWLIGGVLGCEQGVKTVLKDTKMNKCIIFIPCISWIGIAGSVETEMYTYYYTKDFLRSKCTEKYNICHFACEIRRKMTTPPGEIIPDDNPCCKFFCS